MCTEHPSIMFIARQYIQSIYTYKQTETYVHIIYTHIHAYIHFKHPDVLSTGLPPLKDSLTHPRCTRTLTSVRVGTVNELRARLARLALLSVGVFLAGVCLADTLRAAPHALARWLRITVCVYADKHALDEYTSQASQLIHARGHHTICSNTYATVLCISSNLTEWDHVHAAIPGFHNMGIHTHMLIRIRYGLAGEPDVIAAVFSRLDPHAECG